MFKQKLNALVAIGVLCFVMLMSTSALAVDPIVLLYNKLQAIQTIQADYTQQTYSLDNSQHLVNQQQGQFSLQKPDLFRWSINDPSPQVIVSDGIYVWIYDKALAQVTKQPLANQLNTPIGLLLTATDASLRKQYHVNYRLINSGQVNFNLKPIGNHPAFNFLQLQFSEQKLTQIVFNNTLGQRIIIKFSNIQINGILPGELFKFSAPSGVDVLSNR